MKWIFALAIVALTAPGASARPVPIGAPSADDMIDVDPLGYACIPAQFFLEAADGGPAPAFAAGGKLRLARTCLPDPCARPLQPSELAKLTGTDRQAPRFRQEWTDYYVRYADYCRRETTPVYDGRIASGQSDPEVFWTPVLTPRRSGVPAVGGQRTITGGTGILRTVFPVTGETRTTVLPDIVVLSSTAEFDEGDDTALIGGGGSTSGSAPTNEGTLDSSASPLTVVSVPPSLVLLISAVSALVLASRSRIASA